jgi:hypothetical protein
MSGAFTVDLEAEVCTHPYHVADGVEPPDDLFAVAGAGNPARWPNAAADSRLPLRRSRARAARRSVRIGLFPNVEGYAPCP